MMCFNDFVPDPETRSYVGLFYMGFIAANVLVHLIFLGLETFRKLKQNFKRCYSRYITKRNNTANPRRVDVAKARPIDTENPIPIGAANSHLVEEEKVASNSVRVVTVNQPNRLIAKEPL